MKKFIFPLAAASLLMLGLTNCKKEQNASPQNDFATAVSAQQSYASISAAKSDRIDEIVKDLAQSSYSLSFDKPIPSAGITKTAYGADSYFAYADPQDLICGIPLIRKQKYIPIAKIPNIVWPTCPTMIPNIDVLKSMQQFLEKADPIQFASLQSVKLSNGGILLAGKSFVRPFADLKPDKVDDLLNGINPERFVLLNDPSSPSGLFTRNFYGYANLDEYIFKPYKKSLKDILKPKYIGCFDPQILQVIRERFNEVSPSLAKNLGVTQIPNAQNAAILSY